ncbi:MAG: hypothetical protein EPO38_08545 [Rhizorhabdus sp.]|nr:MAG: hypothetical protein EPO38_08545 [Rhizorhabdus sp.]
MLFLGGTHQLFHLAPVAAALSRIAPQMRITCIASDPHVADLIGDVGRRMGAALLRIETVEAPGWWRRFAQWIGRPKLSKLGLLLRLAPRLARARTIVTPERTSALLRLWHLTRARMIHFRHGAGDRAPSSESRLKAFDLIVVPGEKDVVRAVDQHHIDPARLRSTGYVKLDYLRHLDSARPRLFANARPTILYNPHFDLDRSSWGAAPAVVEHILSDGRYNLILAPHIRVAETLDEAAIAQWHALADPDRLIVDFGSDRLIDMSYVRAADIYLGDMSSQLYEFLAEPRPAAFVNAHRAAWRDDPRYAGWHLGEVAETPDGLLDAIDAAVAGHPAKIAEQKAAVARAFGEIDGACERAARILVEVLEEDVHAGAAAIAAPAPAP